MRRCFQCGAPTAASGLTRVGDGEFCARCFGELLNAEAGPRAAAESPAPVPRREEPVPAAPARATCLVCERDMDGEPAVAFLGGEICAGCSAEMAAELRAAPPSSKPGETQPAAPSSRKGAPEPSPVFTPGSGVTTCAGCERPMPGPGSYRVLRGKPYCPGCLPFFARLAPEVYEAEPASNASNASGFAAAGPALAPPPAAPPAVAHENSLAARRRCVPECDCCRRGLDASAEVREGFELCSACLGSDAELALLVAQARHRRALERLRSKLEGDT